MEICYVGFDPGGSGAFGWCVLLGERLPLRIHKRGIAKHAEDAVSQALHKVRPECLGGVAIDAPLFWQTKGDCSVDQLVRRKIVELGGHGGTVNAVNSMRGACLVQGMMTAMLLRKLRADIPIIESHPKALLWLLNIVSKSNPVNSISLANLGQFFEGDFDGASDHERDAALGGLTAFAGSASLRPWRNLFPLEDNPITPLEPMPSYWLPNV